MTDPTFERVYTVADYYDGPRQGIADFEGVPHRYRSVGFDTGEWDSREDRFELSPVSADALALEIEDWAIWRRWEEAFHTGRADASTHPAHPEDRERHEAIVAALAQHPGSSPARSVVARGELRAASAAADLPPGVMREMEVRWRLIGAESPR